MDFYSRHEADVIESDEQYWADKVKKMKMLPKPSDEQKKTLEEMGVRFGELEEEQGVYFYNNCVFPSGWSYEQNYRDGRHMILNNGSGTAVATIFVKLGGYDCFASIIVTDADLK